ncbi:Lar family restriction alleviation protein [Streptomyces sp. ASQP_92]|uniref:Lar family restriction alleviation protein n=1 Tax=Streptomyces sp. ASQP_92 TaxID=2979116 RepID=UPI0021C0D4B0|nr:Lar family restriction alleviation protein [Streptomyces sp. ASQP_92]MCT9090602.1 Lar family restriction alleviation protein [Streptomyces sp. ASQP_92]
MNYATAVHETVAALRTIREQWAELLLAIEEPPANVWPPRQLTHTLRATSDEQLVVEDRAPLVLREHPAPANLDALDAGIAIERQVFGLADTLAAAVQHTGHGDLRRWVFQNPSAPNTRGAAGSRAHGLHFACVWVEGRLLDEDTTPEEQLDGTLAAPPFAPLPPYLLHEARRTARIAEGRLLRTLGLDQRTTPVPDRPCPWCGGELTLHTDPDEAPRVTCSTGEDCTAPVPLDERGRRVWGWTDLVALVGALAAAEEVPEQACAVTCS